jgi:hypothetical protein
MDAVAEPPKVFDPVNARMIDPAAQPEAGVEPLAANDGSRKSDSSLENNSGLLRVHGDRAAGPRDCDPSAKYRTQGGWFAGEVLCQREAPARMPQVRRDESMAAFRAPPKTWGSVPS